MKTTLFFKKYRFSKRIVIKNSNAVKDEEYKELTKDKFLEALHLVPVDELCDSIIITRKKPKSKSGKKHDEGSTSDQDSLDENYEPQGNEDEESGSENEYKVKLLSDGDSKVPCKICGRIFSNRRLLMRHKQQRHSGKKPYSCSKCTRSFKSLDALIAHIRSHDGKLPYECKTCKHSFHSSKEYNKHQSVHVLLKIDYPKVKVFKCDSCPKEFRKLCDLERHLRVHTGEKPYECIICMKKFQQAHNLTKHMIIHTKEKQYKCEVCGKGFGRSDVLNRHMITHKVDKPHHCKECSKSFGRASQLADHVKKHHSGDEDVNNDGDEDMKNGGDEDVKSSGDDDMKNGGNEDVKNGLDSG